MENEDQFDIASALQKQLAQASKAALAEWRAVSDKSSDPRVAAAYARVTQLRSVRTTLAGLMGKAGEENDE